MKEIVKLNYLELMKWAIKESRNIIYNIPSGFGKTFNLGTIIMDSKQSMNVIYFDNSKTKRKELGLLDIDKSIRNLIDEIHYLQKNYYNYSAFAIIEEYKDEAVIIKRGNVKIRIVSIEALELEEYKDLEYEFVMLDDCLSYELPKNIKFNKKISMITMNDYNETLRKMYPNSFVVERDISYEGFKKLMNDDFKEFMNQLKIENPEFYYNQYAILSMPKYDVVKS